MNFIQMQEALSAERLLEDCVILDTETTGLGSSAEVVEVGLIDNFGNVLVDTLVKPINEIPVEAAEIHGITNEMVVSSPSFIDVLDELKLKVNGKRLVIYNASYDRRVIRQSAEMFVLAIRGLSRLEELGDIEPSETICAMEMYARFRGVECEKRGGFKWHKLTKAAEFECVDAEGAHRAVADCKMTLGVLKSIAKSSK